LRRKYTDNFLDTFTLGPGGVSFIVTS